MKYYPFIVLFTLLFSCENQEKQITNYRSNFTQEEQKILTTSRKIISDCYYGTLITIDKEGQPRARVMEPFKPENDFTIWLATNPKSRKVTQIKNNSNVTMHYFDKAQMGYVSLMGKAILINDEKIKFQKWKKGWEKFYKNREEAYLLIQFIPETLEIISFPNEYNGDAATWQPHKVQLRE